MAKQDKPAKKKKHTSDNEMENLKAFIQKKKIQNEALKKIMDKIKIAEKDKNEK